MAAYADQPRRVRLGRSGRRWRDLCAQVYSEETHCAWCGKYVDQLLDPRHPLSRTVDHDHELWMGGAPLDRLQCQLMHRRCNSIKSNRLRGRAPQRETIIIDPHSV